MGRGASGVGRFRVCEKLWRGRDKSHVSGCGRVIVYSVAVPPFFQCVQKRLPAVTQNQAVFPVHVVRMHLYFNRLPDETIPVSCFCGQKSGFL